MPKNKGTGRQILDDSLDGSDFNDYIGIYDETNNYTIGAIAIWGSTRYQCVVAITGGTEGDMSNRPDISSNWKLAPKNYVSVETTTDYDATEDWLFDHLEVDSSGGDVTVTFPADISSFPDGARRYITNDGGHAVYVNPNGNLIDGSNATRIIFNEGGIIFTKVDSTVKTLFSSKAGISVAPDDIPNLELWLDFDDSSTLSLSGNDINSVTSKDSTGTRVGVPPSNKPTLGVDGLNDRDIAVLNSTNNNEGFNFGNIELHNNTIGRGLTVIAVTKPNVVGADCIAGKYHTSGNNREWFCDSNNAMFFDEPDGSGVEARNGVDLAAGEWQIAEWGWSPGGTIKAYSNGIFVVNGTSSTNDIPTTTSDMQVGLRQGLNNDYQGGIAEIIIYSGTLTATEREGLTSFLGAKWGIDISSVSSSESRLWNRDGATDTLIPVTADDNIDLGNGVYKGKGNFTPDTIDIESYSYGTRVTNLQMNALTGMTAGARVFNLDENKPYFYDGTIWVGVGVGAKRIDYGAIMLATANNTPETQSDVRGGITRDFGYCLVDLGDPSSGLSPDYQNVLVDIIDGQEKKGSGLSFSSFPAMYTWLQDSANGISFSGGQYDNNVKAVFYDEIDYNINPLTKLYGKNMFYAVLKGKEGGHGIYKSGGGGNKSTIYNTNWGNIGDWVEDVFADTNTIAGYTYPGTSVLRCFTTPSKFKTAMNGLHSLTTQLENRSNKSHINDSTETITNGGINVYNVDVGNSVFYARNINSDNSWVKLSSLLELNIALLSPSYSVIRVYKLYSGNEYQFYIKPVGIDTLYVDYFDTTKYDLVRVTIGRDQYMNVKTITPEDGHEGKNILKIPKSEWVDNSLQTQARGRNSIKIAKEYKFALRDKTTKRLSVLTKNSIMFRPAGRDKPVDIRVE